MVEPYVKTDDATGISPLFSILIAASAVAAMWQALNRIEGRVSFGDPGLGALLAAVCCLAVGLQRRGNTRLAWTAVALGCAVWAYGRPGSFGTGQAPSEVGNSWYLLLVCAFTAGVLLLCRASFNREIRTKLALDLLAPAIALGVANWDFVVGPYVLDGTGSGQLRISAALHGVGFIVLLTLGTAGLLSEYRRTIDRSIWLLLTGIGAMAIGDAFWLQRLTDWLPVTTRAADGAYLASFLLIGIAAIVQMRTAPPSPVAISPSDGRIAIHESLAPNLALAALLLLAGVQSLFGEAVTMGTPVAIGGALAVLAFVVARQTIARRQERHLWREIGKLNYQIDGLMSQVGRDPLTGLLNHRAVHERLEHELARGRDNHHSLAVVLIDVDNFKTVNDTLGHQAGDRVLRAVAGILESACRTADIAARYAGDEFMLILPGVDERDAGQVCARISREVQRINQDLGLGKATRITLSVGVAVTYTCGRTTPQTVAIADAAMYDAKEGGKNRVVVVNADTLEISDPITDQPALIEAMAESSGAFPWVIETRRQVG